MPVLHLVQGGIDNGDKKWLERAARGHRRSKSWIAPRSVQPGDEVVIYIRGYGFFATGRVYSQAKARPDWGSRYGAGIDSIRLIEPPISLSTVQRHIPKLKWARYPRSIATPSAELGNEIRRLIRERRATGIPDLDDVALASANIDELRKVALLSSRKFVTPTEQRRLHRARSTAIRLYILERANGMCEACKSEAPFLNADGTPYLEAHHVERLADDGPDHPRKVIGLCPNCHRRAHHSQDLDTFKRFLLKRLRLLERA
jgi:HNH endonuclease